MRYVGEAIGLGALQAWELGWRSGAFDTDRGLGFIRCVIIYIPANSRSIPPRMFREGTRTRVLDAPTLAAM